MKIKQMKLREMGDRTKRFNIVPRISYLRRKRMREGNIQGNNGLKIYPANFYLLCFLFLSVIINLLFRCQNNYQPLKTFKWLIVILTS